MAALFVSTYLDFYVCVIIHQPSCLSQVFSSFFLFSFIFLKNTNNNCTFWVLIIHLECSISTVSFFILFCNTGLSYDTNEPVLRDAFGQHGEIIEGKIIDLFLLFWVPNWSCNYVSVATISFFFLLQLK